MQAPEFQNSPVAGEKKPLFYSSLLIFALLTTVALPIPFSLFYFNPLNLYSDSKGLVLLICTLFAISFLLGWALRKHTIFLRTLPSIRLILHYYLVLVLLEYGFQKVFKVQFYYPEPNIRYTPFGRLDRDILYWSTMGVSWVYSVLTGFIEVIAGGLILFRKTRLTGVLLSMTIFLNILIVNISFDITVRLFSGFMLFLTVLLSWPYLQKLFVFLSGAGPAQLNFDGPVFTGPVKTALKVFAIGLILVETTAPYITAGNFNADRLPKPPLHGAYEVRSASGDPAGLEGQIKRLFVHKDGYLIFQYANDDMQDFRLGMDTVRKIILLEDHSNRQSVLRYKVHGSELMLYNDHGWLKGEKLADK